MKKLILICFATVLLSSCGNTGKSTCTAGDGCDSTATATATATEIGSWVAPIAGMEGEQGFTLNADGTAQSINSATLVYKSWSKANDSAITLISESVGNGVTIADTTTWDIKKLDADSLIISSGDITLAYGRKK